MAKSENKASMNMNNLDRKSSILGGGALILYGLTHFSVRGLLSAALGAGLMVRGLSGRSRVYDAIGLDFSENDNAAANQEPVFPKAIRESLQSETTIPSPTPTAVKETVAPAPAKKAAGKPAAAKTTKSPKYEQWTKAELYKKAQELKIEGRSAMSKAELITALKKHS